MLWQSTDYEKLGHITDLEISVAGLEIIHNKCQPHVTEYVNVV